MDNKIILVDMDGTIAEWDEWLDYHVDLLYPHYSSVIPRKDARKSFDMWAGHTPDVRDAITEIFNYPGFYAEIPLIPGAVGALHEMSERNAVYIVTSPWPGNKTCLQDKANWVARHLGDEWLDRLITTRDKTIIHGNYLIDDKPEIQGALTESQRSWHHIYFDQPYNRGIDRPRITSWENWEEVLDSFFAEELLSL